MKTDGVMYRVKLIAIIHVVRHSRYTIYYVPALFTVFDRPPVIYELTWREKDLTSATAVCTRTRCAVRDSYNAIKYVSVQILYPPYTCTLNKHNYPRPSSVRCVIKIAQDF